MMAEQGRLYLARKIKDLPMVLDGTISKGTGCYRLEDARDTGGPNHIDETDYEFPDHVVLCVVFKTDDVPKPVVAKAPE